MQDDVLALQRLEQALQQLHLDLPPQGQRALLTYLSQMQRWNKTYNLTALRDPGQMLVQHVFDSLAVLPALDQALHGAAQPLIVDVGSGAGLPGVVLAVARPGWRVLCVDAVEKKTAFIRQMAGVLALPNLQARHARIETLEPLRADVVVSRAFASLADFAQLAGVHVARHGWLVAMKGREPQDEIQSMGEASPWRVERVQPLMVPELSAQRCLVWLAREGNT